jgi:hypothetical protein
VRAIGRSAEGAVLCKCEACGAAGSFTPRLQTTAAPLEAA